MPHDDWFVQKRFADVRASKVALQSAGAGPASDMARSLLRSEAIEVSIVDR
jgi:hypothetical protein